MLKSSRGCFHARGNADVTTADADLTQRTERSVALTILPAAISDGINWSQWLAASITIVVAVILGICGTRSGPELRLSAANPRALSRT